MPGIGVITNPRSRQNKRDPSGMRRLAYLLGTKGSAEATRSLDDLYRAAEEFKAAGIDVLGINGGDGTIHVTLTAFLEVYGDAPFPKVAILRGGTLNTIARGLRIFGRPHDLLYEVIDRYHQGEPFRTIERPPITVVDGGRVRHGFIFGNGLMANFLSAYYATGRPSPWTGFTTLVRTVASAFVGGPFVKRLFRRFRGRVEVDGETWAREDFVTVSAATVPEVGLGFRPFHRYDERPEHFALIGLHASPFAVALELPRVYRGRSIRRDKGISAVAREAVLRSEEPIAYTIDGDLYDGSTEIVLRTGRTLELIVP